MPEPMAPVTGIARGGLGTATNLDDTQRYAVEDLVLPEPAPCLEHVQAPARPVKRHRPARRKRARETGVSPRFVAIGAFAILALATVLTLRDGGPAGSGALGGAFGGPNAGTAQPLVTTAPLPTTVPEPTGKGHGNGHGHDH